MNRFKIFLIFIISLISLRSFAIEVQGTMNALGNKLLIATPFNFKLELAPSSMVTAKDIESIKDSKIFPQFFVLELREDKLAGKDSDILVFRGLGVINKDFKLEEMAELKLNNLNLSMSFIGFNDLKKEKLGKPAGILFALTDRIVPSKSMFALMFFSSLVLSLFMLFLFRKKILRYFRQRRELKEKEELTKKLLSQLMNIKSKSDLEDVYKNRKDYIKCFNQQTEQFESLYVLINKNQYKRAWNEVEFQKANELVSFVLDNIGGGGQ